MWAVKGPRLGAATGEWGRPWGAGGSGTWVRALLSLSRLIDAVNVQIGRWCAWAILVAVAVSATNAVVRKMFDMSSNAWLELQWVLFSLVFLLCASWTLRDNEHIRIDIVNNMLPRGWRNAIDIVGHTVFLLPLTIIMIVTGIPFFTGSFAINEQSTNAGGLPQWPAKALIAIGFALLGAQAISELIKRIAILRGLIPDPHATQVHVLEAEVEHVIEAMRKE
jgi:TRAP-type mannitol/chloroaromatic compound transport system permease small subunit